MLAKTIAGEPIVFARRTDGQIFALRDICPHRAMPLSCGKFDGEQVKCAYHGWVFNEKGTCTDIPWLTGHENIEPTNFKTASYDVHEAQGNIWVFIGENANCRAANYAHKPPVVPGVGAGAVPHITVHKHFPCHVDHAAIGLMDPSHASFIHQSWWWRGKSALTQKSKAYGPSPYGFVMKRHQARRNSLAYNILGGIATTEIAFYLPGIRIEHIETGTQHTVNFTCVTPLDENNTEVTHMIYWTHSWLHLIIPFAMPFVHQFLDQDLWAVKMQQKGLKYDKSMLLLRDADTLARWYFQLKNEYVRSVAEERIFNNPVPDVTLSWRS